jgi:hypothetical protein
VRFLVRIRSSIEQGRFQSLEERKVKIAKNLLQGALAMMAVLAVGALLFAPHSTGIVGQASAAATPTGTPGGPTPDPCPFAPGHCMTAWGCRLNGQVVHEQASCTLVCSNGQVICR